jgi:hypothetical protein
LGLGTAEIRLADKTNAEELCMRRIRVIRN